VKFADGSGRQCRMPSRFYTVVVDSSDPATLARFWAAVLDWQIIYEAADEVVLAKSEDTYPGLVFGLVPEAKSVKNRLHIDLVPDDQDAEVARVLALGATRADVGQSDVKWVVLADPEGNEFCILSAREGNPGV
jgi:predicted enzyme related to lactoylglutathione lyase